MSDKVNRGVKGIKATCHPSRAHWAKGFCKQCYAKEQMKDPVFAERQKTLAKIREQKPEAKKTRENYRSQTKEYANERNLLVNFGIEKEEWIHIYESQKGICPLCLKKLKNKYDPTSEGKTAALDHDHKTGLIRGLLCQMPCNGSLGGFGDSTEFLKRAYDYVVSPPATDAFGKEIYTLPGRIATKIRRKLWKKYGHLDIKNLGLEAARAAEEEIETTKLPKE